MRSRIITVVLVIAAFLSVGGTSETSTMSWTYVPGNAHIIGPDEVAAVVAEETGVRTAPTGDNMTFYPLGNSFRIRLDDLSSPSQRAIHVSVGHSNGRGPGHICLPPGRTVTFRRVDPRYKVSITVWDATFRNNCPGVAAGGTLTVMR
jgi:hypothetical protein